MKSIYEQELATRTQRKGESLRELSIEIKRLAELAYPGPECPLRNAIILSSYLRSIGDEHVRSMTCQLCPKDLQSALDTAMHISNTRELESNRAEVVRLQRKSGQVRAGEYIQPIEAQVAVQSVPSEISSLSESVRTLCELVTDLKENPSGMFLPRANGHENQSLRWNVMGAVTRDILLVSVPLVQTDPNRETVPVSRLRSGTWHQTPSKKT